MVNTGDLHVGVYDLTDNIMYVADARDTKDTGPLEAFRRQFIKIDLNVEVAHTATWLDTPSLKIMNEGESSISDRQRWKLKNWMTCKSESVPVIIIEQVILEL